MQMFDKNISQHEQQDSLIESPINTEQYSCETREMEKLTQKCQLEPQESPEEVEAIRLALIEGEESIKREGYSKRSVDEIFNAALKRYHAKNG